jgi:uncharacterized protein YbaP (TraB family)
MQHVATLLDRIAALALRLAAAINVLFLIVFLAALLVAAGRIHAAADQCKGKDLLKQLAEDDPALLTSIEEQARSTPNGKGLLWKIEIGQAPPSYLFGTMHVTDPRVTTLPAKAARAFESAGTVVIETTEILDQASLMGTLARHPDLMMFTDDTTLSGLLASQDRERLEQKLAERGIPLAAVEKMKPWLISAMVALPACEWRRKQQGLPVLDVRLAEDARAAGKKLEGLETVADQMQAMASLPMELHLHGLADTLRLGDRLDDVIETMIVLYGRGDTGTIWPLLRTVSPGAEAGYAAFEKALVSERNKTMLQKAEPIIAAGDAFIAVGALHLPGPDGLIEQFRRRGFTVSPVP